VTLHDWLPALISALHREPVVVRILLADVRGSAPREPGVGMLVDRAGSEGTIGGGQLEWEMLAAARGMLEDARVGARLARMVLGADLGQCCGGVVEVWLERFTSADLDLLQAAREAAMRGSAVLVSTLTPRGVERRVVQGSGLHAAADRLLRAPRGQAPPRLSRGAGGEVTLAERLDDECPPLWLYGAGHVGQALARILMELPLRLTWIDSRAELFPADLEGVRVLDGADPVASVADAPPGARFVVLTHSHPLDYALCRAILARNDFAWVGLIGSASKAARFRSRMARDGLAHEVIAKLVCPIGIGGIASKWPAAIAVGIAAQLLREISASAAAAEQLPTFAAEAAAAAAGEAAAAAAGAAAAVCAPGGCASCGAAAESV
jgi:xanthine dehydrogenase accessory factor